MVVTKASETFPVVCFSKVIFLESSQCLIHVILIICSFIWCLGVYAKEAASCLGVYAKESR